MGAAQSWMDLETQARALEAQGEPRAALNVWTRVLRGAEATLGPDEPHTTAVRVRLAWLEYRVGDAAVALEQATKAFRARLKLLGPQHPQTAELYALLAQLELRLADPVRALGFAQKVLRVRLALGPEAALVADAYEGVGVALLRTGDRKAGLEYLQKSRRVRVKRATEGSLPVAASDHALGAAYLEAGDPKRAQGFLENALKVREQKLGPDHPETAATLTLVGIAQTNQKRYTDAIPKLERALKIRERVLGPDHPDTASTLAALGSALAGAGDPHAALQPLLRAVDAFFSEAETVYRVLDTPGKLRFNLAHRSRVRASLRVLTQMPDPTELETRAVAGAWLSFKGLAFSLENGLAPLSGQAAGLKARIDEYLAARTELASLYTRVPNDEGDAAKIRNRQGELEIKLGALERELSSRVQGFTALLSLKRLDANELRRDLLEGEAFVDYAWLESGLYAVTVTMSGVHVHRVADTAPLETAISRLRQSVQHGASLSETNALSRPIYDALFKPLEADLEGVTSLTVSPDGPLNFLPFELLWDGQKLALDRWTIRYAPTGRDLVRLRSSPLPAATGPAAVFGNADFSARDPSGPLEANNLLDQTRGLERVYLSGLLRRAPLSPLPYTEVEARAVSNLLGANTTMYLGVDANEKNLLELRSPRVLHLATHGFFFADAKLPNPLMRVGIALAGARASAVIGDGYGLLSGLRLEGLSLAGTELVVLSACDTALGDAFIGEGVAGFNQVFLAAGARRVMLTLWKVPDLETAQLMEDFYRRWRGSDSAKAFVSDPAQALRAAKIALVNAGVPPQAWASVVLSGE
jgi:CHAT domain-containing protein/tetratricopeptide (TPR) repeat protein